MKKFVFVREFLAVYFLGGLFFLSSSSIAAGDVSRGKAKSVSCAGCHGADGNSVVSAFPKLAGQHKAYLVIALKAYKSGTRNNPVMQSTAKGLNDEDIEDLAAYFSSQKQK